jgi:phosphoenolpyruvate carboxykinase (ATP)
MEQHHSKAWLVSTGWTGGPPGIGSRMKIKYTRAIIDAIHSGDLDDVRTKTDPIFGLAVPVTCPNVPDEILIPKNTWADHEAYDRQSRKLARLFRRNFEQFKEGSSQAIINAGPELVE